MILKLRRTYFQEESWSIRSERATEEPRGCPTRPRAGAGLPQQEGDHSRWKTAHIRWRRAPEVPSGFSAGARQTCLPGGRGSRLTRKEARGSGSEKGRCHGGCAETEGFRALQGRPSREPQPSSRWDDPEQSEACPVAICPQGRRKPSPLPGAHQRPEQGVRARTEAVSGTRTRPESTGSSRSRARPGGQDSPSS